jgi:Holliday junction resolvasome RuvABC ATP-dependent DNA helicase subunit
MPSVLTRVQRLQQLAAATAAAPAAAPAATRQTQAAAAADTFGGALHTYPGTKTALHDFSGVEVTQGLGNWTTHDSKLPATFAFDASLWAVGYAQRKAPASVDALRKELATAGARPSPARRDNYQRIAEDWKFPDGSIAQLLQGARTERGHYNRYHTVDEQTLRVHLCDRTGAAYNLNDDEELQNLVLCRKKNTAGNAVAEMTLSPNTYANDLKAMGFVAESDRYFIHPDGSWAMVAPSLEGLRLVAGHLNERFRITGAPSTEVLIPEHIRRLVTVSGPADVTDLQLMAEQLQALHPEILGALERAGYTLNVTRHKISNADESLKNQTIAVSASTAVPVDRAEGVHVSRPGTSPSITVRTYMKEGQLRVDVSTLLHEIGHAYDLVIGDAAARNNAVATRGRRQVDELNVQPDIVEAFKAEHQRLPSYFHTEKEFVAEAFALYMLDPARCERQLPQMFKALDARFSAIRPDAAALFALEQKFDRPAVANVVGGDIAKQLAFATQRNRVLREAGMPTLPVMARLEGGTDAGSLDVAIDAAAQVRAAFGKQAGVYRSDDNLVIVSPETFNDAAKMQAIVDDIELTGRPAVLFVANSTKLTPDSAGFGVLKQTVVNGRDVPPLLLGGDSKSLSALDGVAAGTLQFSAKLTALLPQQQAELVARFAVQEGFVLAPRVLPLIEAQLKGGGISAAKQAWTAIKGAQFERQLAAGAALTIDDVRTITAADIKAMKMPVTKSAAERLAEMVGQDGAKRVLDTVAKQAKVSALREAQGLADPVRPRMNLLFSGAPGTGKTTFAEILGSLLQEVGYIKNPTVTKVTIQDLVDGKPEVIVKELFENNKGGVIFIDEMHQLKDSAEGRAAYKAMIPYLGHPDHKDTVFIGAGYNDELGELIRNVDAGGERRFTTVPFIDYDRPALAEILDRKTASRGMHLDTPARDAALAFLDYRKRITKNFGNAGEIDVALDHAQKAQTLRIAELPADKITAKVLTTVTAADFAIPAPITKEAFWKQLDAMSGWDDVKALLKEKAAAIEGAVKRGKAPTDAVEPYWIVDGPPGTGKSTLSRLLAQFGAAYGLTAVPEVVDVQGANFQGEFVGQTAGVVTKQFEKAWGRLMFVDEVSGLARSGGDFKYEAAKIILAQTENHRGKFMMVIADYPENINQFLKLDPGLARRFGNRITLAPWTPKQATDDLLAKLKGDGVDTKGLEARITKHFDTLVKSPGYASGGDVRTLKNEIIALLDASTEHDTSKSLPRIIDRAFTDLLSKKGKDAGAVAAQPASNARVASAVATAVEAKPKLDVGLSAKDSAVIAAIDAVNVSFANTLNGLSTAEIARLQADPKGAFAKALGLKLKLSPADAVKQMLTVQVKVKKLVQKQEVVQRFVYHCPYCGGVDSPSCGYINEPIEWKIQNSLRKPWTETKTTEEEIEVVEERQVDG